MPLKTRFLRLSQQNCNSFFQAWVTTKNAAFGNYATRPALRFRSPMTNRTLLLSSQLICRPFHSTAQTPMPQSSKPQKFEVASSYPAIPPHILEFDKPFSTARKSLVFVHGASGVPKSIDKIVPNTNTCKYNSVEVGEDSYYRRHDSLGVADGVGSWRSVVPRHNAVPNSAAYSRKLMHHSYMEMEKYDDKNDDKFYHYDNADPAEVLGKSYKKTERECSVEGVIGSSTALVTILRGDELRIANIGDCGIAVIRNNMIVFRTEEMQHSFNYPIQLGTNSLSTPHDAQKFTVNIRPGDIIVAGSDGLFDNLFDDDIVEEVRRFTTSLQVEPQAISDALARRALIVSEDPEAESPFACRAMREGLYYQGGKEDDITVLVALVLDAKDVPGAL